ncbi:MAG: hypothetical protein GY715_19645 [Planctomycetes bacterium]|nr:hypothetical protein [Planctomycetota bacterium]
MLMQRNITRGLATTWCVAHLAVSAVAQPSPTPDPATLPDAGGVVSAYLTLREWVTAFDVPNVDDPASRINIQDASGACVVLRYRGRVLGIGTDNHADDLMIRRAAGRALSRVLGDEAVSNLPDDRRERIGETLTLELECAGRLVPLPGRSFARIAEQIEPGLDGVAMRRDESVRLLFPSQLRARNTVGSIEQVLPSLAVDLELPARELDDLSRRFDCRMYRFRTIHLAQRTPTRRPFESFRGQVLVEPGAVATASIDSMATGLTNHIFNALWMHDEPIGLMGDYHAGNDVYDPLICPPATQALTALALGRYAGVPTLRDSTADRMRSAMSVILRDLGRTTPEEIDPISDPAACAAIVLAVAETPSLRAEAAIDVLYQRAAEHVARRLDDESAPGGHGGAMLVAAAARMIGAQPEGLDADRVRAALDRAWSSVPEHQRVSLLPWIGWAELDYARATGRPPARVDDLRMLRTVLEASRIGTISRPGPPDLHGGFALTGPRGAHADAQTARPAAFLATMLRQETLTPAAQRDATVAAHLQTMRFLQQLAVDDTMLWATPGPQRAKGGIRAATWSLDQPAAAQALGLLAASETLISLHALRR